jgi:hypothetical protein
MTNKPLTSAPMRVGVASFFDHRPRIRTTPENEQRAGWKALAVIDEVLRSSPSRASYLHGERQRENIERVVQQPDYDRLMPMARAAS